MFYTYYFAFAMLKISYAIFLTVSILSTTYDLSISSWIPYKDVMHNVFNKKSENESMKEGNRFVQSLFKRRNAIFTLKFLYCEVLSHSLENILK